MLCLASGGHAALRVDGQVLILHFFDLVAEIRVGLRNAIAAIDGLTGGATACVVSLVDSRLLCATIAGA